MFSEFNFSSYKLNKKHKSLWLKAIARVELIKHDKVIQSHKMRN